MQLRSDLEDICKVRETLVNTTDPDCYQSFVTDLREVLPNATIFLSGKIIHVSRKFVGCKNILKLRLKVLCIRMS